MKQWLIDHAIVVLCYLFRVFRVNNKKIVITSYLGRGYGDNPKYIVEKLLASGIEYDIVWLVKGKGHVFPSGIRIVDYQSLKAIYELCTAKVWIDNRRKPPYIRKRKTQCYIMTWHGFMAIKKIEKDAEDSLEPRYIKMAKNDSKMIDYFVAGSRWESATISDSFWYDGAILECGYPRCDILLKNNRDACYRIKKDYGLSEQDRILLYAPTFRQAKDEKSLSVYKLDWDKTLETMKSVFGGNWIGMIRLHPNVAGLADLLRIPKHVIDATTYDDMQELITACDCMITDYSSSIMDAGVARKLGFIFATDYEEYAKDRDVYFDIKEDLPFPFAESNDQLIDNLISFDKNKYYTELERFLKYTYGVYDEGNASSKICELIEKVTRGSR